MAAPTVTMQAPSGAYTTAIGAPSGQTYTTNANGLVAGVAAQDVAALMAGGYTVVSPGFSQATVRLSDGRNTDGSALAAAATSGKFGQTISLGTALGLVSQVANSSTVTDNVIFEVPLPASFEDGYAPTVNVNCQQNITVGATLTTHNLTAHLYPITPAGVQSADVVTGGAQAIPVAAAELAFPTSTTALLAGGRVMIELTASLIESGGTNASMTINSLTLS